MNHSSEFSLECCQYEHASVFEVQRKKIHHFQAPLTHFRCLQLPEGRFPREMMDVGGYFCKGSHSFRCFLKAITEKLVQDYKYKNHQEPPSNLACWQKRLSSSPRPSTASRFFNMSPVHSFYLWRASGSLSVCLHKRPSFDLSLSWWNIGPMGMVYLPTNLPYTSAKCR